MRSKKCGLHLPAPTGETLSSLAVCLSFTDSLAERDVSLSVDIVETTKETLNPVRSKPLPLPQAQAFRRRRRCWVMGQAVITQQVIHRGIIADIQ